MTAALADPLINGMAIARILPVHESSRRLRKLTPESPRVHGVAVMSDIARRRWWPLATAVPSGRVRHMFETAAGELGNGRAAAQQLAATVTHGVLGRVVTLMVLEGRAWDPGPENLWMHVDSEGAIDWAGVTDPTLRVLPDDPAAPAWSGCPVRRRWPRGWRTAVTARWSRSSRSWSGSAAARSARRRCGRRSGRPWSSPPPRFRCSAAPVSWSACGAARRSSTR